MRTAAVITVSDRCYRGERTDTAGPGVRAFLEDKKWNIVCQELVPDDAALIQKALIKAVDEIKADLVLTVGGTGFAPRDITPEATLPLLDKLTRGIPEAMRAESMKITSRGCLSRAEAGIRKNSLIINLPGSPKSSIENLKAVMEPLDHALLMLSNDGSADCALLKNENRCFIGGGTRPSADAWINEARSDENADRCGMYLIHDGVVRSTAKKQVRGGIASDPVTAVEFSFDEDRVLEYIENTKQLPGIGYVKVWLAQGKVEVGGDLMMVLVGGDIRPNVIDALQYLVGSIKSECVDEKEIFD